MLDHVLLISLQIVLESFPVSSSGHTLLVQRIFSGSHVSSLSTVFDTSSYEIMLWEHAPTVLVVALFFVREWFFLIRNIRRTWRIVAKLIFFMVCSNTITTLIFIIVRAYKIEIPLWIGFGITTVMLLSLAWCRRPLHVLTYSRALILGLVQGMAWLPGVSRFASVFVASRWMGISNRRAWRITWMLEWPMAFGVFMLSLIHNFINPMQGVIDGEGFVCITSASIFALLGMRAMSFLMYRNSLWVMGLYTLFPFFISYMYRL